MSIDSVSTVGADGAPIAFRPTILGTRHVVSAGHYLAAQAAFQVLEGGGNAIDAGVAGGLVLGVVQSEFVNIAGVAPIMIRLAATGEVMTISGLGVWPAAARLEDFVTRHGGTIPNGILRTVVPAAPDAWITALARWGTMSFADAAGAAIRLASDGFVMYPLMAELIGVFAADYAVWPQNAAIYLPRGSPPRAGDVFVQADLGRTLRFMADQDRAAQSKGRAAGLTAARDAFYRGDIAGAICNFHRREGGLLTREDMAAYRAPIELPLVQRFADLDVYTCGPWCQGPVLAQMLAILDGFPLRDMARDDTGYAHLLIEAMKLAFLDRERHYADPAFHDVPMARLLGSDHVGAQRARIQADRAIPYAELYGEASPAGAKVAALDTSYISAVDRHGNVFSATPSDVSYDTPVIPGTGLCPSSRGSQSWAIPGHPCAIAPGTRPRLTPNPAIAVGTDTIMGFGTPGGDVQCQAMLQVLLNWRVHGMDLQRAIEAARVATYSFPDSFEPHMPLPDKAMVEGRSDGRVMDGLAARGHDVGVWPDFTWRAGGVCATVLDRTNGVRSAAADPRRPCYAQGW
ncbi:MAG: gamma-glutamyltransferase family protein [Alphaproteobacteria bacterium]|nr:gamma-glutamyltransferase family protein [Alphaproteobacteria bacterium]